MTALSDRTAAAASFGTQDGLRDSARRVVPEIADRLASLIQIIC